MSTKNTYRRVSLFTRSCPLPVAYCLLPVAHRLLRITYCLLPFAYCLLISSCRQLDVYEKDTAIPNYEWQSGFVAKGSFTISDTTSTYNLYVVLRHTDAYKYNNIWLDLGLQNPGDSLRFQKINLSLGNDLTGWEGTGMNDIWEVRSLLNSEPKRFRKAGTYNFSIAQIMRDNPLLHIMSVGLRLENPKRE